MQTNQFRVEAVHWVRYCGLTVIVRRAEGVVSHTPPRGEDDKVSDGHTWSRGFGSQHSKDRRILQEDHK